MSLAAMIQITDQDTYTQSAIKGSETHGQLASTANGLVFAYGNAGGALSAGQITQPTAVTANYATRTLSVAAATGQNQVSVPLGTTASADAFVGYWFVVTDGTGAGQGAYRITSNTAATSGNSNTTVVTLKGFLNIALDTTSVVGLYPNQESSVVQHTAVSAIPTSGAPIINITSAFWFWNQVGGYASILSDATVPTKNAYAIPSAGTPGAVTIDTASSVTQFVGYAPELAVSGKYSPLILTVVQ